MTTTFTKPARRARTYAPSGEVGNHLSRARDLQLQIQELTAQYDTERDWLLTHMVGRSLTKVELGEISCVLKERKRWTYSPDTQLEMQRLQVTQKWEQSRGIAVNDPTFYVALSATKPPAA